MLTLSLWPNYLLRLKKRKLSWGLLIRHKNEKKINRKVKKIKESEDAQKISKESTDAHNVTVENHTGPRDHYFNISDWSTPKLIHMILRLCLTQPDRAPPWHSPWSSSKIKHYLTIKLKTYKIIKWHLESLFGTSWNDFLFSTSKLYAHKNCAVSSSVPNFF